MSLPIHSVVNGLFSRVASKRSKKIEEPVAEGYDPQVHLRLLRLRAEFEQESRPIHLQPQDPPKDKGRTELTREVA